MPGVPTDQRPTDAQAKWIYGGKTADEKPILAQATVANNAELQRYIVDTVRSSDVPSTISYSVAPTQPELGPRRYVLKPLAKPCATAECAAGLTPAELLYYPPDLPKEQIANTAAAVSTAAGRFGAATGAIAAVPSPYAPAATTLTFGASVIGLSAGMIEQTERYPLYGPVFNEIGGVVKGLDWINQFKQPEKK